MIDLKDMMTPIDRTIHEKTTLQETIVIMKEKKWNIIPVTDGVGRLIGVFTRSQLYTMLLDQCSLDSAVTHYIKKEVVTLSIDTPYEVVQEVVRKSRVGTGIVLDKMDRVIGLFTKTDMVMALLQATHSLKDQLEIILKSTHLGVVMTDENNRIIYVNDRFSQMQGEDSDSLLYTTFESLFPTIDSSFEKTTFIPKVMVGHVQTMLRLSSYHTIRGNRGMIALFHDTSELELMAEELQTVKNLKQTMETAIEHAFDGILMIDQQQKITMVSPPLLELFDLTRDRVLQQSIQTVLPQLQLSSIFITKEADISDFMEIKGIKFIVHRIPIVQDGEVVGVLGKVMFRQLNEVNALFKKLEKAEHKAAFYHQQLQKSDQARFNWEDIISSDSYMEKLKKSGTKAAKGRSTILIRGESGTGKELFAHAVHNNSARKDSRFVVVNCAAIPEDLLESEFFGYEAGAFTGARTKGHIGKFDLANGGTLFLDEIGDMSLTLQAKLLRVLQEKEFYRVGGTERIYVDVRIIAATNQSLEAMVEEGTFREDLYYRLNVISLTIPPLRERKQDIHLLLNHLMDHLNRILGTSVTGIETEAKDMLLLYDWPGNVRELKNVLERAMTFADYGKILIRDLPEYVIEKVDHSKKHHHDPNLKLAEHAELSAIKKALDVTSGNKTRAAHLLGISRSGLYEKLKKYHL